MLPHTDPLPRITLTVSELMALEAMLEPLHGAHASAEVHYLERELDRAEVLPKDKLDKNVVTMNSVVTYLDHKSGQTQRVKLVYPQDEHKGADHVSILSPVGVALIGMYAGKAITWYAPNGDASILEVLDIIQPD